MIEFFKKLFRQNKKQTQEQRALEHLKKHGSVTIRELSGYPFYFNCGYGVIRNLRNAGHNIEDDWISYTQEINGIKAKGRYKRYKLETNILNGQTAFIDVRRLEAIS